jgi:hypothetical protein
MTLRQRRVILVARVPDAQIGGTGAPPIAPRAVDRHRAVPSDWLSGRHRILTPVRIGTKADNQEYGTETDTDANRHDRRPILDAVRASSP